VRVAVTGASGFIGSALVPALRADGHEVRRLVRRRAAASDEVAWDPAAGAVDLDRLAGVDAVVNLSGASVGGHRWTTAYKEVIRRSRVDATTTIAKAVAELDPRPSVLVSAAAIGYYGDTGGREVDETSPPGDAFLSGVVVDWERSAAPARDAGVRVVHPRSGLVMARHGGAFGPLVRLTRLGLGGRLGSGRQWWSWITLADEVRAIEWLLRTDVSGPVNLTTPTPATNAEITRAIGAALHRPALLPVPAFALTTVLGELSSEVLGSARVLPRVLTSRGFHWEHLGLPAATATLA
jgi:uncharacterized protein (TIGR01777 family)